jgi:spore coat protein U-like protein
LLALLLLVGLWLLPAGPAQAQTCSAAMTPMLFSAVSPVRGVAVNTTATLTVTCNWPSVTLTPTALACVNLGTGTTSTSQNPRTLGNGANRLQYRLAGNTSYNPLWGSTATSTTPISVVLSKPLTGTSASQQVVVNGQVLANQFTVPTVGNDTTSYTESFAGVATVNYSFYLLVQPACASLAVGSSFTPSVSASVVNDCLITATPMDFGPHGLLTGTLTAGSSLSVRCTNNDAYRIALNGGMHGTVAARNMQLSGGNALVAYQLFTDAGRTIPWGDGLQGTSMVGNTGTGNAQVINVYGSVTAQNTPVPGSYMDTVTATVYF